jgi:hypothetical protein
VIWIIPWIYFGAFLWLSTAFLFYMNIMLKREEWRDKLSKVLYERQYKHLLNLSVGVYIPIVPYIILKMIFQIFFLPWWSDTIGTLLLFGVFILGILFSPFVVTTDIKKRKKELLIKLHNYGYLFFEEVAKDLFLGKIRSSKEIGKAIIMHLYNDDMYEELSKKVIDSSLIKTIMFAAIGPIASYVVKIILSGNFMF